MDTNFYTDDEFEAIGWPEIQDLMDEKGFKDNCFLINDEKGYEEFGDSAYMCRKNWLYNKESLVNPIQVVILDYCTSTVHLLTVSEKDLDMSKILKKLRIRESDCNYMISNNIKIINHE